MSAPDTPIERLNYFNGQRLEASDFRAEQDYFIGVRRWLNRTLYQPGIASGLEVEVSPKDPHSVVVHAGLALDAQGREIILQADTTVLARGVPTGATGLVFGNYLVISYAEVKTAALQDGCSVDVGAALPGAKSKCGCGAASSTLCTCSSVSTSAAANAGLTWGGMSRIRSDAILEFMSTWPTAQSGRIVLAQLDLDSSCKVKNVLSGMRQYTAESKPAKVTAVSLEGEKDIDVSNPKQLFFHLDGGNADNVTLYLRATQFSTLFYTELGNHTHTITGTATAITQDFSHTHTAANSHTDNGGDHTHNYFVDNGETSGGIDVNDVQVVGRVNTDASALINSGPHQHTITSLNLSTELTAVPPHSHPLAATAAGAGATDVNANTGGVSLSYVDSLQVAYDGNDITPKILQALSSGAPPGTWTTLGDGTNTHALAKLDGTGPIELKQLGLDFAIGRHYLTFSVNAAGKGGQIQYNLYVS